MRRVALLAAAALLALAVTAVPAVLPERAAALPAAEAASFVPGEVVVKLAGEWRAALGLLLERSTGILGDLDPAGLERLQETLPAPSLVRLTLREGLGVEEACALLSRLPMVEAAQPNFVYRAQETVPDDPRYGQQWNLRRVRANEAWDTERGSDAFTLAVIDTGLDYDGAEFASRCVEGHDFFNNDTDPYDDDGHGTAVASVAAAATNNGELVAGMAWYGKIMPLKALGSDGKGNTSSVAQSIYYAATHGADVVNMSFTSSGDDPGVRSAVSFAVSSGCLLVAAVGNEGSATQLDYPAAYPDVIGVGSVDFYDHHSGFSNHNSSVDLVAPGERGGDGGIPVVLPGDRFAYATGTSLAAAHVAGAALLVWSDDPALTAGQVWQALRDGARDLGAGGWDEYYGFGRLDVMEALGRVEVTVESPAPYAFDPAGRVTARARSLRSTGIRRLELYVDGTLEDFCDVPFPRSPLTHTFSGYDLSSLGGEGGHRVEVRALDTGGAGGRGRAYYYTGGSQPRPATAWYLAEGTTAWGFDTWVLIQNPNPHPVTAYVTYMKPAGPQERPPLELPGGSRTTIHLNAEVPPGDVSTMIASPEGEVVVERSMYWNGRRAGHDSIGVNAPSTAWYLAEGTTAWGFEEFVLVQNPNGGEGETARVTLDFMRPDGSPAVPHVVEVAPASRRTVSLNQVVPAGDVSVRVTSDLPVVVERAMYWNGRSGGHGSIGAAAPSRTWYLAEGTTAWGFEEFVLVQNPSAAATTVTFSFLNGRGRVVDFEAPLPGNARYTLNVADVVGAEDVSAVIYAETPVVAERAMYWNGRTEGHASIGSPAPAPAWYLAEGTTAWGFEEWVLISNPTDTGVHATLACMLPGGGGVEESYYLPPFSRVSVDVAGLVDSCDVSVAVYSGGSPVVAERAMYWGGRSGGTCSIGAMRP